MKKISLSFLLGCLFFTIAQAQTFSDNFDTYTAGTALGPQSPDWTTWSGTQGGTDDINVSGTGAHSGNNCLYFTSTSTSGGPSDIVLPFGGPFNTGQFTYTSWFKVASGKMAYFNFQATNTPGQTWALNCFMQANGTISFDDATNILLTGSYPTNTWFELSIDMNLSTNVWDVKVNGTSIGTFMNSGFQVASIDMYASDNTNSFWVDDVSYNYVPATPTTLDGAVVVLGVGNGLVGQSRTPTLQVRNLGTTAITSFDINVNQNGTNHIQSVTGVNIASLAAYTVNFTTPLVLAAGLNTFTATISNVNGNATDNDATNDSKVFTVTPTTPAPGKIVVAEEGTGTWCQWCPRGAVFMDLMSNKYPGYFKGIAVHNNDPMTVVPYDSVMGLNITGYPSALVDRGAAKDPSIMEPDFLARVVVAPKAILLNGAHYDASSGKLDVSITTNFQQNASGNYALACVLTEDSVKGTGSSYNQANAYAGGGNGVMGGFETKPNPVPASQMRYDHVARAIAPGWGGVQNAYGASMSSGQSFVHHFTFNVGTSWHANKIDIVGLLIDPSGKIDNASTTSISEAVANGYAEFIGINTPNITPDAIQVYPNPAADQTNVLVNLKEAANATFELYDLAGTLLTAKTYALNSGMQNVPLNLTNVASGVYLLKVTINGTTSTLKVTRQ